MNVSTRILLKNILFEGALAADKGDEARVRRLLADAMLRLNEPVVPRPAPEDDPERSAVDRAAWRAAR